MSTKLAQMFLDEHQHLTRGLYEIHQALKKNDLQTAAHQAEVMDCLVGAHMEFEEEVFYPELATRLGDEFVSRLYDEHDEGQLAVKTLLSGRVAELDDEGRTRLLGQVEIALDHAISCGTLLSHIGDLDPAEEERVLERWQEIRARSPRWSEQAARSDDA